MKNLDIEINKIRNQLIDSAYLGLTILLIPSVAASILRAVKFGWQTMYIIQLGIALFAVSLYFYRNKLSVAFKTYILAALFIFTSFLGAFNFGISSAYFYCFGGIMLVTLIYGKKQGLYFTLISMVGIIGIALLHIFGLIERTIDYNIYNSSVLAWISVIISLIYLITLIIYSIGLFNDSFIRMIKDLKQQTLNLENTNNGLLESQIIQKGIFDSTADLIWVVDAVNFGLLQFNSGLRDYFLHARNIEIEIGDQPDYLLPTKEFSDAWYTMYHRALNEGSCTIEYLVHNGTKTLELSFNTLKRGDTVFGISVFGKDITERKKHENELIAAKEKAEQSEQQLQKNYQILSMSEERYRSLYEGMLDAYVKVDLNNRIIEFNQAYSDLTGYEKHELYNRSYVDFTPEKWHEFESDIVNNQVIKYGHSNLYEKEYRKKDGTIVPIELRAYLIKDKSGNPESSWAIIRDITERKKFDNQLIAVKEKAEESEKKIRTIFSTVNDSILITEVATGKIVECNDRLVGYSREEMLGKTTAELNFWISPDDRTNFVALLKNNGIVQDFEATIRNKNGITFTASISANFITLDNTKYILSVTRDVTERKQAEDALRNSQQSYLGLFNTVTEAIYIHDEQGVFIDVNVGAEKMYGYSREELIGKTPEFVGAPDKNNMAKVVELISKAFITGKPQQFEYWGKRKNGECFPKDVITSRGKFFGKDVLITTARDISERKKSEEELRIYRENLEEIIKIRSAELVESEEKYRTLVESLHEGIAVIDFDENFTFVNTAAAGILGHEKSEIIGTNARKYLDAGFYEKIVQQTELRKDNISSNYDLTIIRKDGSKRYLNISANPVLDAHGTPVTTMSVFIDITERKLAEQELQRSEQQLRLVTNNIPALISLISKQDERYLFVNQKYADYLNLPVDQIIGKKPSDIVGESFKVSSPYLQKAFQGIPSSFENSYHLTIGTRWLRVNVVPDIDENGEIIGALVLSYDITEQKEVEGKLNTQNQQLSELIATKDKFFSIIAHDLKNPFNVLIGTSEQLLSNYSDQESTKVLKMVTNIHEVSKQAYSLLENLLIWSKIQSGKLVPQTQKIDISNLIYEVCRNMINIARQKNIEIETDLESDNTICADPDMIMTVLRNLLSNAIKFTYQNGQIFIKCLTIENSIEFHVKDSGTGIESEHLEKLFGIESKLSKPGTANETGTGLGLILCKEFVEMHGGKIWVESEVGCGSDFRFTIPYV